MSRLEHRAFEDAHAIGLVAQDGVAAYLSRAPNARVWKADHPEGGAAYFDANGLPIPDLIKMQVGRGATLVEVKAKTDWFQEGGTVGPLETMIEDRHIRSYSEVASRYRTPVVVVFVMRIDHTKLNKNGKPPRGHAGCWFARIEDLLPLLELKPRTGDRRGGGRLPIHSLYRIQDGGPLRPLCPWDEATKSVPMDLAAWEAWLALEPLSPRPAITHQSGPQFGSPSH